MRSNNRYPSWRKAFSVLVGLGLVLLPPMPAHAAETRTVVVTGEAVIGDANEALAKDKALKTAFRAAIEKGLGTFLSGTTRVSNFSDVQDKILTRAEGYVLGYEIVREWRTGDVLHVQVSAQVGLDQLKSDVSSLTQRVASQLGNPAVAFVLTTYEGEYKLADMTIIDAFQEEFLNKGFDLKAVDKAREAAVANLSGELAVFQRDRQLARNFGAKEGANYVARGQLQLVGIEHDPDTGGYVATSQIGVEILDAATGDVVGAYGNALRTTAATPDEARALAIKKNAVVAARTLASQTIAKWQDRANNGQIFTLVLKGVRSARQHERPFKKGLADIAEIRHAQLDSASGVLTVDVRFRGTAEELEDQIYQHLEKDAIFKALDKEGQQGNTLVFKLNSRKEN